MNALPRHAGPPYRGTSRTSARHSWNCKRSSTWREAMLSRRAALQTQISERELDHSGGSLRAKPLPCWSDAMA
jgi:hypothetical protein